MNAAPEAPSQDLYADLADLKVGMFVHLDLSWLEHPFPQSSFKIKNADQIATIRGLRLTRVRWSPHLSELAPEAVAPATAVPAATPAPVDEAGSLAAPGEPVPAAEDPAAVAAQLAQVTRSAEQRLSLQASQKALDEAVRKVKGFSKTLHTKPLDTREQARELVGYLADEMLAEADVAIRLMADQMGGESTYHHALNVTLLSLMLARALKAPPPVMQLIGLGALFHDIGKFDIPDRITRATGPLTRAESALLQTHTVKGLELGQKMGLSPEVMQIIEQHHEMADGSGYPRKLKGNEISLPTRVVAVVNAYDNLCNALNPMAVMTPHEALAMLYGRRRGQFDEKVLGTFVRCLGVYPPGSLVRLSDDRLAMVVAINSSRPLKPTVMVFDPTVPKETAPLLELEQAPGLSIAKALRPQELPQSVRDYLMPGLRTTYYFSADAPRPPD